MSTAEIIGVVAALTTTVLLTVKKAIGRDLAVGLPGIASSIIRLAVLLLPEKYRSDRLSDFEGDFANVRFHGGSGVVPFYCHLVIILHMAVVVRLIRLDERA